MAEIDRQMAERGIRLREENRRLKKTLEESDDYRLYMKRKEQNDRLFEENGKLYHRTKDLEAAIRGALPLLSSPNPVDEVRAYSILQQALGDDE